MPVGPVFTLEWRQQSRRWQLYAARAGFALILLAALTLCVCNEEFRSFNQNLSPTRQAAALGQTFAAAVIGTQLALLLLAAPAATAGGVCHEKLTGQLVPVLASGLTASEIILGKLLARLVPVFGLILVSIPVLSAATWMGGIDPESLPEVFAVMTGTAVLAAAFALFASVIADKVHDVLMLTYLMIAVALMAVPLAETTARITWNIGLPSELWLTHPFVLVTDPYMQFRRAETVHSYLFLAGTVMLAAVFVAVAVVRLRPAVLQVAVRRERKAKRRHRRWLETAPLDWYEWHRKRPSRTAYFIWAVFALLVFGTSAGAILARVALGQRGELSGMANLMTVGIGLLFLTAAAVTSLSEERSRGSLDVLMTTPVETAAIVRAKWWATFRLTLWLVIPVMGVAYFSYLFSRTWPVMGAPKMVAGAECLWLLAAMVVSHAALWTSVGLALAVAIRRPARAVAVAVAVYAYASVGWMFTVILLSPQKTDLAECFIVGSPLYATAVCTLMPDIPFAMNSDDYWRLVISVIVWAVLHTFAAVVLYEYTKARFDHSFGRLTLTRDRPENRRTGTANWCRA